MNGEYYDDRRFCKGCQRYVSYLFSMERSYCVECGGAVQLMSDRDLSEFQRTLSEGVSAWGQGREDSERESA